MESLSARPGFAAALVQLTLAPTLALEIRQLAAVLLKRFVRTHWSDEAENFAPPAVLADEKAAVRAALPAGLHDPVPRVRTAVGMVVAAIAAHDFPDEWPSLMGELLQPLEAAGAGAAAGAAPADDSVAGVLRCLELCVGELDEGQLLAALERLLPLLLALYGGAGQPPRVRARAVRVLHRLLAQLTALCDSRKTLAAVRRSCAGWVTALLASLASAAEPAAAASPPSTARCRSPSSGCSASSSTRCRRRSRRRRPRCCRRSADSYWSPSAPTSARRAPRRPTTTATATAASARATRRRHDRRRGAGIAAV